MAGKIKDDQQIGDLIKEGYGIAPEERIGVLGIGMSSNYEKYKEQVLQMLERIGNLQSATGFLCLYHRDVRTSEFCGPFLSYGK